MLALPFIEVTKHSIVKLYDNRNQLDSLVTIHGPHFHKKKPLSSHMICLPSSPHINKHFYIAGAFIFYYLDLFSSSFMLTVKYNFVSVCECKKKVLVTFMMDYI